MHCDGQLADEQAAAVRYQFTTHINSNLQHEKWSFTMSEHTA